MLYLFHDNGKKFDFLGQFKSMKRLKLQIDIDLDVLRNAYPKDKWSRRDYLVARRVR